MRYNEDFDDAELNNNLYSNSNRKNTKESYTDISSNTNKKRTEIHINYEDAYSDEDFLPQRPVAQRSSSQQVSSRRRPTTQNTSSGKGKKKRKKHKAVKIIAVVLCCLLVFAGGFYAYAYKLISKIKRNPLDTSDLGRTTSDYSSVRNIALLGLDTREDNDSGRSDAIIILTVDKKHKKLKLSSIARDTYVSIDGHGKDKLTHAYAYGKSQLAVKTLNQNFNLEITDYVTVNFHEFAKIIDYVGGVTLDIDQTEKDEMNVNIIPFLDEMGIPCDPIVNPGVQHVTGAQALSYARIRHTDNDVQRGNRQKEVLTEMFSEVKKMNPFKLPNLASMIVNECETSMSTNNIMSMGLWSVFFSPEFEQLSIPNANIPSTGKTISGKWCYVFDLTAAQKEIKDFIFEENFYSAESVAQRASEEAAKQ